MMVDGMMWGMGLSVFCSRSMFSLFSLNYEVGILKGP